jgi:hypothetical protein
MAFGAIYIYMRGVQVGCILRWHSMAGGPTERWGVGVIPAIYPTDYHRNGQNAQYCIGKGAYGKWGISRREKKVFQPISKSLHDSSGEI